MKNALLCTTALALIVTMGACNGTTGTTSSSDSTSMNPGDSSVTTTTTTTTVHRKYSGSFVPQPNTKYLDLRTKKEVVVKIDTVKGEVVNSETDEPIDLFVEPTTHDTIYGQTGTVVNNYITHYNDDYKVDTVRINTVQTQTVAVPAYGKAKYKSPDEKTKQKGDKIIVKEK
jgi:hypothetical protein